MIVYEIIKRLLSLFNMIVCRSFLYVICIKKMIVVSLSFSQYFMFNHIHLASNKISPNNSKSPIHIYYALKVLLYSRDILVEFCLSSVSPLPFQFPFLLFLPFLPFYFLFFFYCSSSTSLLFPFLIP